MLSLASCIHAANRTQLAVLVQQNLNMLLRLESWPSSITKIAAIWPQH